ncbi:hypothetical protein AWC27_18835 [Mycobacterium szulgai]|uniref:DUF7159 domain-containing protein n=1 Tax=Mycobacterium szulgai TaxID=1787 RepID=A0A1X2FC70_MYCSZ|nr:hypothetical protein [Mycobacterium szulgai]ORX16050.1 hypothetical protein AWC27_18835 [Mycobacterium szulgai]
MDIVLGVSMEPATVRLVLIEGENADGVTVEEDNFEVAAGETAVDQAIAALIGTREGAAEGGYQLVSTGVTWTNPADVGALRAALAAHDVGSVMLVSPLLAAAALAQTVGSALDYGHIAMLFVEVGTATLAVVDVADGSIVDLHRQSYEAAHELATIVAGLDAPQSRSEGVFVIGCGVDIIGIKPLLEAATSLAVSGPEEPVMALARGAALASANAPLFASSTAALAYALDPGTGEVNPRALTPGYLDVCANAELGALAYSALDDLDDEIDEPEEADEHDSPRRSRPLVLTGGAMAGIAAFAAGVLVVSLTSDVRPAAATQPSPPVTQAPAASPHEQFPIASLLPPPEAPPPPVVEQAPPAVQQPPPAVQQPPPVVQQPAPKPPPTVVNMAPATPPPRRQPTRQAAPPVQTPVPQAPAPSAPPVAVPPPAPEPAAQPTPIMTMYLHVPFVTIPIPIYPPSPPPPPPEPGPAEPAP